MQNTKISWTDHTFNPWIGCAKVSEGCRNCYAIPLAKRMGWAKWGVRASRYITSKSYWEKPRAWNRKAAKTGKRIRVFVASLADVFDGHPDLIDARKRLWTLIRETPNLDWLLLTKRPENILGMLPPDWGDGYDNVWLGTSVEDMRVVNRIDALRAVPAAIRFVSYEPAIGPLHEANLDRIDWLICGGESDRSGNFRPMDEAWAIAMRDKCIRDGVEYFFKQHSGKRSGMQPTLQGVKHRKWPRTRRMRKVRKQTGVDAAA